MDEACKIGHFDSEIDVVALKTLANKVISIKPDVDQFILRDGRPIMLLAQGRLVNLGCATGHSSFVMSTSFSNQVFAQMELWQNYEDRKKQIYTLPRILDEQVARLHLNHLGVRLDKLTSSQADYIGVDPQGPFKPDSYRY